MKHHYECRCGPKRVYDCAPLQMENVCVQVCLPPGLGDTPCISVDRNCVCVEVYDVKPTGKCDCFLLCGSLVLTLCAGRSKVQSQVPFQVQMRTPREAPYEVAVLLDFAEICTVIGIGGNLYTVTMKLCGNYYIVVTAPGCCPQPPSCLPLYPPDCHEHCPGPPACPPVCPPACPPVCPPVCPPACPPVCPPACPPVCLPDRPSRCECPSIYPGAPGYRPQPSFDLGPGPCDPCNPCRPSCPPPRPVPRPKPWRNI